MTTPDSQTSSEPKAMAALGSFFWELIKIFLIAVAIIVPVRYFLIQPFFVRGASMEPNFEDGEYLIIDELSYRFREPLRGEVVVFRYPEQPSQFFIKRIVGLPGDTIIVEEGQVKIQNTQFKQGVILDESAYLPSSTRTGGQGVFQMQTDEYFVLGDNRPASSDSRSWGVLKRDKIIGRTWIRAFPFDKIDLFSPERTGFVGS
ncbi:MAG: signal peptidase I [Candidatus Andersenbacteria bacterium]